MPSGRIRFPHPLGMTKSEAAIYARLKKGPAALSSLAHAGRCSSGSIKAILSRLRRKLPAGESLPRSMYGYLTYGLQYSKTADQKAKAHGCKTETKVESAKPATGALSGGQGNIKRNKMLYASESLPDYTLCEWKLRLARHYSRLAWATILRSWYSCALKLGTAWLPAPVLHPQVKRRLAV